MPQCRCEDMQIPKITISTVNSIACPGILYAHNNHIHIFNNHLIRKKYFLWNAHLICMWDSYDIVKVCFQKLNCFWGIERNFEEVQLIKRASKEPSL